MKWTVSLKATKKIYLGTIIKKIGHTYYQVLNRADLKKQLTLKLRLKVIYIYTLLIVFKKSNHFDH